MSTLIEYLRQEILESQKARMDFIKFKLLSIAVLGAFGLGLNGNNCLGKDADYILCIIPLLCIYIDLVCYHNNIRIFVVANYFRASKDDYERFLATLSSKIAKNKKKKEGYLFELEDLVIKWTSFFVSLLLMLYGSILYIYPVYNHKFIIFAFVGVFGLIITFISKKMYQKRVDLISLYQE